MAGPDGVSRAVQHNKFYLRGGDVTFHVENHIFRVHSLFFYRESLFFRQKFNDAANNTDSTERGSTDTNAYNLDGVKSEDFSRFLWVFYNERYSLYEAPLETWLSILKLANQWGFDNVKELCVRELEKIEIEAVEKVSIYHDHNISRLYLLPSYIDVCKRDKPLGFAEGMKLGMETVLRIAEARERLRQQASESGVRSPTFEDFEDAEVEVLIRDIFHLGSRPTSPATSPPNGINGAPNNPIIKLNPAPPGNHPKANGAPAPRANGGSAADPRPTPVNSMPSIATVISPQVSTTLPTAAPPPPQTTVPLQDPRPQVTPARVGQTASTSPVQPPPPPPATDKPRDKVAGQETNDPLSFVSSKVGGVGEPSSLGGSSEGAFLDDLITKPVVSTSSEKNNVLTAESTENVNDAEKDESNKDADTMSVVNSDTEGGNKNKQGSKSKKGPKLGPGRGGKSKS